MAGSSSKRVFGTLLFVAALVVFLAFAFLLFADAEKLDDVPGVGNMGPVALVTAIVLGVFALLLILLLVVRSYDQKSEDSDSAEAFFIPAGEQDAQADAAAASFEDTFVPTRKGDLVVYDLWTLEPQKAAWGGAPNGTASYHYPRNIQAGVYANDYIDVSPERRLKLRTLLAGPADLPTVAVLAAADLDEPVEELPGDSFMADLESRYATLRDTGDYENYETLDESEVVETAPVESEDPFVQASADVHYDYGGDVHEVIDVEGIGPIFAQKLQDAGVRTTDRLCYEDAEKLAARIGTEAKRVYTWQHMAELMKVSGIGPQYAEALARAGIEGIQELKKRSASALADQINEYLGGLDNNVLGNKITARRVEGWQEAAKPMRRTRRAIPAE